MAMKSGIRGLELTYPSIGPDTQKYGLASVDADFGRQDHPTPPVSANADPVDRNGPTRSVANAERATIPLHGDVAAEDSGTRQWNGGQRAGADGKARYLAYRSE